MEVLDEGKDIKTAPEEAERLIKNVVRVTCKLELF